MYSELSLQNKHLLFLCLDLKLIDNKAVKTKQINKVGNKHSYIRFKDNYIENQIIRVFKGPEFDKLSESQINTLINPSIFLNPPSTT